MLVTKFIVAFRSSHPELFCEKGVPKNFAKFTGTPVPESLFNKAEFY